MTKVTLARKSDIKEIACLIRENISDVCLWPDISLHSWIGWFVDCKLIVIGITDGKIKTLMMGRPILVVLWATQNPYYHDFFGDKWYMDCVINPCSIGMTIRDLMIKVLGGTKEKLAYSRQHGSIRKVHIYPLDKVLRYYATKSPTSSLPAGTT